MTYGILWLSRIAYSLLLTAAIIASAARCKKSWWRKFWPIFSASIVFLPIVAVGIGGYFFLKANIQPKWLFWYGLSETIVYVLCVIIIFRKGLKGATSDSHIARHWPRARLGILFGLAILIYVVTLNIADIRILAHLANIRSEAVSQIAYLLPAHHPKTLNAYAIYEKAAQALGPRKGLPDWFNESGEPDFDIASTEVHGFLSKNQDVLATVRHAASMPGYNLEVDISNFFNYPIPQYLNYRSFAKLLSLSARSKARIGDITGAFQELIVIERMADHLYGFPILISSIAATALETIQYETLENILAGKSNPTTNLSNIPIHTHPSILDHFTRALRMEAQSNLHLLTSISLSKDVFVKSDFGLDPSPQPTTMRSTLPTIWWRVYILPSEIRAAKDIITYWMTKPVESYESLQANLKTIYSAAESGEMGIFTGIGTPSYGGYISRAMSHDAMRGLYDMALAITSYKVSTGQYPAQLEDLVPTYIDQIPLDPFDNKPLKMKPVAGGLDLYSIGPEQEIDSDKPREMIHFYLGREAYDTFRIKPKSEVG